MQSTDEASTHHQVTAFVIHGGFMLSANICLIIQQRCDAVAFCVPISAEMTFVPVTHLTSSSPIERSIFQSARCGSAGLVR